jgi:hypothetical protein
MNCNRFRVHRWLAVVVVSMAISASAEWNEKVLYSFQGGTDGSTPAGAVVFDAAGNLYGTTTNGGSSSCRSPFQCGTVYQLKLPAKKGDPWTETVLHVFKGNDSNDGASPFGGLVMDAAGNLYGTTGYDGTGSCILLGTNVGCGTVYELSPPAQKGGAWTETVIYNFQGNKDGQLPIGDLVFDKQGSLYGATQFGGGYGSCNSPFDQHCGTVFELSPPKTKGGEWKEKVLYSFKSGKDGANPNGGLVFDSKGVIYGTTYFGGNETGECSGGVGGTGCGTVFALQPPGTRGGAWTNKVLHRFNGQDGATPAAGVVFGGNGNLYGTTYAGAVSGNGAVFELAAPTGGSTPWKETVLHRFSGQNDGENPTAGLILDANGNLYGATEYGNSFSGTAFRLTPPKKNGNTWTLVILYGFTGSPDGAQPAASLTFDKHGKIYGTTQKGGTGTCSFYGCGTVFEVSP